jgi:hypothetical protein
MSSILRCVQNARGPWAGADIAVPGGLCAEEVRAMSATKTLSWPTSELYEPICRLLGDGMSGLVDARFSFRGLLEDSEINICPPLKTEAPKPTIEQVGLLCRFVELLRFEKEMLESELLWWEKLLQDVTVHEVEWPSGRDDAN